MCIKDQELLARYIYSSNRIRSSDLTVKPSAFMPPDNLELSVTRHLTLKEDELWIIGEIICSDRSEPTLHGRADIETIIARNQDLDVKADPKEQNHSHAIIIGWPSDKPQQKMKAIELAKSARFISNPNK
jgi:hypothetical protein